MVRRRRWGKTIEDRMSGARIGFAKLCALFLLGIFPSDGERINLEELTEI
jgi:hypothetical protein